MDSIIRKGYSWEDEEGIHLVPDVLVDQIKKDCIQKVIENGQEWQTIVDHERIESNARLNDYRIEHEKVVFLKNNEDKLRSKVDMLIGLVSEAWSTLTDKELVGYDPWEGYVDDLISRLHDVAFQDECCDVCIEPETTEPKP